MRELPVALLTGVLLSAVLCVLRFLVQTFPAARRASFARRPVLMGKPDAARLIPPQNIAPTAPKTTFVRNLR
jgi:hypothetical protein